MDQFAAGVLVLFGAFCVGFWATLTFSRERGLDVFATVVRTTVFAIGVLAFFLGARL